MSDRIKLVQGDSRPQLRCTLTDENTGAVINITDTLCNMKFRASGTSVVLDTLAGIIIDGVNGIVVFAWNPTTLNVPAGDYEGEIEVLFNVDGGIQTVYNLLKFTLREDF